MAAKDLRAAKRYALALFAAAQKQNSLETVEKDMSTVLQLMQASPALRQMWDSPLVPSGRKRELIKTVLEKEVSEMTLAFLRLLVDKRREDLLETVDFELRQQADAVRHIVRAEAIFAIAPTGKEQQELQRSLEQHTGENVQLTVQVDPAILGGVIVRMQDTIYDGSVRGTLERLRERLLQEA